MKEPLYDKWLRWLRERKFVAFIIVVSGVMAGIATTLDSGKTIFDFVKALWAKDSKQQAGTTFMERPQVFFKNSLFIGPIGSNDNIAVDLVLSNSGAGEAKGEFDNISFRFEPIPYSRELRYFAGGAKGAFVLSPSQETHIRVGSTAAFTSEMISALNSEPPRARLYIYSKGWYSDLQGSRAYDLSFCRMYHPSMPGNLIYCPEDVSITGP